jgi:hypothetical protein
MLNFKLKKLHLLDLELTSHGNSCTSTEHAHPSYAQIALQMSLTHLSQVGAKIQCPNSTPMCMHSLSLPCGHGQGRLRSNWDIVQPTVC